MNDKLPLPPYTVNDRLGVSEKYSDKYPESKYNYTTKSLYLGQFFGNKERIIELIEEGCKELDDCQIHSDGGYEGYDRLIFEGYTLKTQEEIDIYNKNQKLKEEKELKEKIKLVNKEKEQLRKLLKKYPECKK